MNNKKRAGIDALINSIEHQIMELETTLPVEDRKLDELRGNVEQLKSIRDNKDKLDFAQEQERFIESIPHSVRVRVTLLARNINRSDEDQLVWLCKEAKTLLLYDTIYSEVDTKYDLPNPMLHRLILSCIDNQGQVPDGADRDDLLCKCPHILAAIENAYNNKQSR